MTTSQTNLPNPNEDPLPVPPGPQNQGDPPACQSWCSLILLLSVASVGLTTDLVSKHLAFAHLPNNAYPLIRNVLSLDRSMNFGALFGIGRGMTWVFILASIAAVIFVGYMFATSRRGQWVVHLALGLVLAGALGNLYDRLFVKVDVVMKGSEMQAYGRLTPDQRPDGIRLGRYPDAAPPTRYYPTSQVREGQAVARVEQWTAVRDFIRVDLAWRKKLANGTMKEYSLWPWIFNVADSMLVVGVGLLLIIYWRRPVVPEEAGGQGKP